MGVPKKLSKDAKELVPIEATDWCYFEGWNGFQHEKLRLKYIQSSLCLAWIWVASDNAHKLFTHKWIGPIDTELRHRTVVKSVARNLREKQCRARHQEYEYMSAIQATIIHLHFIQSEVLCKHGVRHRCSTTWSQSKKWLIDAVFKYNYWLQGSLFSKEQSVYSRVQIH